MLLTILLLTPLIAATLTAVANRSQRALIEFGALTAVAIEAISAAIIVHRVAIGLPVSNGWMFAPDAIGAFVIMIIALVGIAATIHSVGQMRAETEKGIIGFRRVRQYFVLYHLFFFAMFAASASTTPLLTWVLVEATTLSTAFLITIYNKPSALEAGWKHLIINSTGLLFGLLGTLMFLSAAAHAGLTGTTTWADLLHNAMLLNPTIVKIAFVFILVGYGTKTGFVPLHTWKPDAYSKAPAPIGALLSGVLISVAFTAIIHFMSITNHVLATNFTAHLLIAFGILSILVAPLLTTGVHNYKRMLAYSSVEHSGVIALGLGFGGVGIAAALLHMLYHALAKPLLFFAAGNVFIKYSSTKIAQVRGAYTLIPFTAVVFMGGILAVTGMPPFGIFFTKLAILSAGVHHYPYVTALAVLGFAAVFMGLIRATVKMLFGEPTPDLLPGEANAFTVTSLVFTSVVFIILSFYVPTDVNALIHHAASSLQAPAPTAVAVANPYHLQISR